ncbi:hypothetical protein HYDPIDRAFT_187817 [Hydnomerulius pinastri MD-312]|uniref:Uncharacterized protein n=1 Tax=Hydnomerulius pinastri MD-312 TaxID=994086 RepID=A0A0C9W0W5_9AGAM|nr:hypothetical protein HYDPIDRAFT_187817 [Hydnomerulius pinastri MD-312]
MRILAVFVVSLAALAHALVPRQVSSAPAAASQPQSAPAPSFAPGAPASSIQPAPSASASQPASQSTAPSASAAPAAASPPAGGAPADLTTTANGAVDSAPYTVPINPATFFWTSVSVAPGVSTIHM